MEMKDKIISLFRRYGFEYRNSASNNEYLAFTFKSGFFHNAELVSMALDNREIIESEMDKAVKELEQLGFSTKKSFYKSIEDIDKTLFEGFFNVKDWKDKIKKDYIRHTERTLNILPKEADSYTYIEVPYKKNNKAREQNIIRDICNGLKDEGPQLSIIEAPAGFGKTCTSYEIINSLVSHGKDNPIPFFTEFSRDRQARVFSHILVREVDKSFNSVNSDVVIEEVKRGRIVIVLDGFDELLHDSSTDDDETDGGFENAEPMLETISELLTKNAKIILTSRRSAIFDGELFNEWIERYEEKFIINRYRLDRPEVKDWIPEIRLKELSASKIDVTKLANPVLLSYLRFVNNNFFTELCKTPSLIVTHYFTSMLEREMDRQDLRMNPGKQTELLSIIADDMCSNNYTSDSKEKIISIIKEKASHLLNEVRTLYSPVDKPSIDKLATTLSNHAFLDRSNQGDNNIEFVNEFVFGNYISEHVINTNDEWIASDERFVEPAVLSYIPREESVREKLWSCIQPMCEFVPIASRMRYESDLTDQVKANAYDYSDISSLNLKSTSLFREGKISHAIFNNSTFIDTTFHLDNFDDVTFLNCNFWDCQYTISKKATSNVEFYNCNNNNNFESEIDSLSIVATSENMPNVEVYILSKMWPVGSSSISRLHFFTATLFQTDDFSKKEIVKGIKLLKKKNLLNDAHDSNFIAINKNKISEIKEVLGRS